MKLKDFLSVCKCLVEVILDGEHLMMNYPYIFLSTIGSEILNYDVVSIDTSASLELIYDAEVIAQSLEARSCSGSWIRSAYDRYFELVKLGK